LTDFVGAIVELYAFDAYGNAISFDPSVALTEFLYSGEQFDSKIGQQYLLQRYYDPVTGRFNRLDPFFGNLNDPQSLHKYLYTHGDPVNGIDPSGQFFATMIVSAFNFGMRAGITATTTTAVTAAISGAFGAGYYMWLGQDPWIGAYNGALIGSSISMAYFHSTASKNFKYLRNVLISGATAFVSRLLAETAWEYFQRWQRDTIWQVMYDTHFKAIDSAAIEMFTTACGDWWDEDAWTPIITSFFDTLVTSILTDLRRTPQPTTPEMVGNAAVALSIEIAGSLLVKQTMKELCGINDDNVLDEMMSEAGLPRLLSELFAKTFIAFDTEVITTLFDL
jgi:RHS repeat-associated protein